MLLHIKKKNMTLIPINIKGFLVLLISILTISACNKDTVDNPIPFEEVEDLVTDIPPTINSSPADFTIDLLAVANSCSEVATLTYNLTSRCPLGASLTATMDAPGLLLQTPIDEDGNIEFYVEFCSLDPVLTITMTVEDECGNSTTDEVGVTVIGEQCITLNCQKFQFALGADGTLAVPSNSFDIVDNLCSHILINTSYDRDAVSDTLRLIDCQSIIENGTDPNILDTLYFSANGRLLDTCRVVIFISNDPNGDGDLSDGWQEICGL